MAESDDKDYTVSDRRFLHMSEEEKAKLREEEEEAARKKAAEPEKAAEEPAQEIPLPEAFVHLGDIPDPATGEINKNVALAQQTIDLLGLLREKTRNNLLEEEEKLFDHLLYDLRMRYIKETT
jgi:hypothetical protein